MIQLLLPQFAKQFKSELIELENQNNAQFRLTLESVPMLQEDLVSTKNRIFLRMWRKTQTSEGCVSDKLFSSLLEEALSDSRVQNVMAMFGEELNINAFLENYFLENQQENKADRFFMVMSLVDTKNKLTRKATKKGLFQMLTQTGSQFKVLQKFEV